MNRTLSKDSFSTAVREHFGDRLISIAPLPGARYDDVLIVARGVTSEDRVAVAEAARRALMEGSPVGYILIDEKNLPAVAADRGGTGVNRGG
jgi:hypothetical protein